MPQSRPLRSPQHLVISATAPTGAQSITVTTPGGTSNAATFTVTQAVPTLSGVVPSIGVQGTSVSATLSGTNLTGATLNLPAGITPTAVNATASQITASLAIGASAATGPITATAAGSTSNAVTFTVTQAAPTLSSITPPSGKANSTQGVKILGTNFSGATVSVSGGDITVTNFKLANPTEIDANFVIPTGAAPGPRTVSVTTRGTASLTFTVN